MRATGSRLPRAPAARGAALRGLGAMAAYSVADTIDLTQDSPERSNPLQIFEVFLVFFKFFLVFFSIFYNFF